MRIHSPVYQSCGQGSARIYIMHGLLDPDANRIPLRIHDPNLPFDVNGSISRVPVSLIFDVLKMTDLIAELVDELIEAEVDLGLHLVVEELLLEHVERVEGGVVVQVQGVQHTLHVRGVLTVTKPFIITGDRYISKFFLM